MPHEDRILILEDDMYARDMMALLLRRDWRTQVIAEIGSMDQLKSALRESPIDLILMDTEHPDHLEWVRDVKRELEGISHKPGILCVGTRAQKLLTTQIIQPLFRGYILKGEIGYSLSWAVTLAASGTWVATPGVEYATDSNWLPPEGNPVLLQGKMEVFGLTPQETEIARLAILFNLPRSNLAHELNRSPYTIYEYVHKAYEKLAVREIYEQGITPEEYFADDPLMLKYYGEKINQLWTTSRSSKDLDTLAFHLLTMPEIL